MPNPYHFSTSLLFDIFSDIAYVLKVVLGFQYYFFTLHKYNSKFVKIFHTFEIYLEKDCAVSVHHSSQIPFEEGRK